MCVTSLCTCGALDTWSRGRSTAALGAMETFALRNDANHLVAFEIPSSYFISSSGVARYFSRCPGVSITKVRRLFAIGEDVHAQFSFKGESFDVWEPFGDNSRFWVGPSSDTRRRRECIDELEAYVQRTWPGPVSAARAWLLALFRRRASA